ncbi:MAG: Rieske 2Fe-2S domain-containing protein, partial [Deinococcus sp.]|nr:Rieske 2Fe-2S domain-containing protein [Deinococcus sp.]
MTKLPRRGFLDWVLSGGVLAVLGWTLYPILRYLFPPSQAASSETNVVAAKLGELAPSSGKVFPFGDHPAILVSTPAGELRAFTAVCTHLQCTVQYRPDEGIIWCACH